MYLEGSCDIDLIKNFMLFVVVFGLIFIKVMCLVLMFLMYGL